MDTLKNFNRYWAITFIIEEYENWVLEISTSSTQNIPYWQTPTLPADPSNPFEPWEPWTSADKPTPAPVSWNATYTIKYYYNSAVLSLVNDWWYYFYDYWSSQKITEIPLTNSQWTIISYWYDQWQAYAAFFTDGWDTPNNVYFYFDTSNDHFKWFYLDWNLLSPRQQYPLLPTSHTLTWVAGSFDWEKTQISWWQSISQKIMQWQTCLPGDSVYEYNYLVYNKKTWVHIWMARWSSRDQQTQTVTEMYMPFIWWWTDFIDYHCYNTDYTVLSSTATAMTAIHRQWDISVLEHTIQQFSFLTTDEYFDYLLAAAQWYVQNL